MGVKIRQLNEKYGKEDPLWNFSLFTGWLERHKIPNTSTIPIISETLKQVLIKYNPDTLPETHDEFDKSVLKLAQENIISLNDSLINTLEELAQDALKKYDEEWYSMGKTKKIWKVLRGKD